MLNKDVKSKSFRANVNPETKVLKVLNRDAMNEFLDELSGEVEIIISEVNSRTHHQNNYYWKVVVGIFSNETGHTKDEIHKILKDKFKVESTAKLNTFEFADYLDRIIRWGAIEWGYNIPDPDEPDAPEQ